MQQPVTQIKWFFSLIFTSARQLCQHDGKFTVWLTLSSHEWPPRIPGQSRGLPLSRAACQSKPSLLPQDPFPGIVVVGGTISKNASFVFIWKLVQNQTEQSDRKLAFHKCTRQILNCFFFKTNLTWSYEMSHPARNFLSLAKCENES